MTGLAKGATAPVGLLLLLAFLSITISNSADARPRRAAVEHHHKHTHVAKVKKVKWNRVASWEAPSFSWFASAGSLVSRMERDLGTNPTGWARVWCGQYLGMIARSLGMTPPAGFPLAVAWARFGVPAHPAPGMVAVMKHHVGVVRRVLDNGRVEIISGNHNRRVGIGVYPTNRVIAWRAPG